VDIISNKKAKISVISGVAIIICIVLTFVILFIIRQVREITNEDLNKSGAPTHFNIKGYESLKK